MRRIKVNMCSVSHLNITFYNIILFIKFIRITRIKTIYSEENALKVR